MLSFLNLSIIFRSLGFSLLVVGLLMLTPLAFAVYYNENTFTYFISSSLICISVALLFLFLSKFNKRDYFDQREAYIIVFVSWVLMGFFGALPFWFSGYFDSFVSSFFESVSGFTTTGASVLVDIEALPKSILFWRSLTHWIGGIGILVMVIAIMPSIGYGSVKLFVSEISGASSNKLHPKLRKTALYLLLIYVSITLVIFIMLLLGEMNFFESITHAFGTVSTGGFSPNNTSIFGYSSYSQIVITVFMFLSAVNFSLYFLLISGHFKKGLLNKELIYFFGFVVVVSLIVALILYINNYDYTLKEKLIHSFFQITSIVSTCGFGSADYMLWPELTWFFIFLMFFSGGMIGSTSGGIKFTRHLILIKNIRNHDKKLIHPNALIDIKNENLAISEEVVRNFLIVFLLYILFFVIGSLSLSLFLTDPKEAMGVTISCLSGTGPAFGQFGPAGNYSGLHEIGKLICSALMIIGRLEVLVFVSIFHPSFWKK